MSNQETAADDATLRKVFDSFDLDGNSTLERDEILAMSTKLGQDMSEQQCDEAMAAMDEDGNGTVSFDEFKQYWAANAAQRDSQTIMSGIANHLDLIKGSSDPELEGNLLYAFQLIDEDNSGSLDHGEVTRALARNQLGDGMGIAEAFAEMEKGPSGEVMFQSFRRWCHKAIADGRVMPPARKAAADGAVADGHWKVAKSKMHALLMYKEVKPAALATDEAAAAVLAAEAEAKAARERKNGRLKYGMPGFGVFLLDDSEATAAGPLAGGRGKYLAHTGRGHRGLPGGAPRPPAVSSTHRRGLLLKRRQGWALGQESLHNQHQYQRPMQRPMVSETKRAQRRSVTATPRSRTRSRGPVPPGSPLNDQRPLSSGPIGWNTDRGHGGSLVSSASSAPVWMSRPADVRGSTRVGLMQQQQMRARSRGSDSRRPVAIAAQGFVSTGERQLGGLRVVAVVDAAPTFAIGVSNLGRALPPPSWLSRPAAYDMIGNSLPVPTRALGLGGMALVAEALQVSRSSVGGPVCAWEYSRDRASIHTESMGGNFRVPWVNSQVNSQVNSKC